MPDFKPTVDLRQNTQPKPEPFRPAARPESNQPARPQPKTSPQPSPSKGEGERRLPKELEVEDKQEFQRISRPLYKPAGRRDWKALIIMIVILLAAGSYYWFIYRPRAAGPKEQPAKWYMVKLTDSETFYGQIGNTSADPVVINNVYYDYDQLQKKENGTTTATADSGQAGSIRLVKRGKETHGPDGSLSVVRSQVLYMEPLAGNSKVLKAIEEYEKGK